MTSTASSHWSASPAVHDAGTSTDRHDATSAPTTSRPPAETRSWRADSANTAHLLPPCGTGVRTRSAIHSTFPARCHNQPMTHAVASDPTARATTTPGSPGNATAVATRTTGFTAGAASRNASAAASGTPWPISLRATGTDAHSHPGNASPARPATGTAAPVRLGSTRRSAAGDTNAAIAPDTSTPSTRNGSACTQIATNTVATVRTTGAPSTSTIHGRATSATTSRAANT